MKVKEICRPSRLIARLVTPALVPKGVEQENMLKIRLARVATTRSFERQSSIERLDERLNLAVESAQLTKEAFCLSKPYLNVVGVGTW